MSGATSCNSCPAGMDAGTAVVGAGIAEVGLVLMTYTVFQLPSRYGRYRLSLGGCWCRRLAAVRHVWCPGIGSHVVARSERLQSPEGRDESVRLGAQRFELVDEFLPNLVLRVRDALTDSVAGLFELLPILRQIIHQVIDDIGPLNACCQRELLLDRSDFCVHRAHPLVLENLQRTDPAFPALDTEVDQSGDPGDQAAGGKSVPAAARPYSQPPLAATGVTMPTSAAARCTTSWRVVERRLCWGSERLFTSRAKSGSRPARSLSPKTWSTAWTRSFLKPSNSSVHSVAGPAGPSIHVRRACAFSTWIWFALAGLLRSVALMASSNSAWRRAANRVKGRTVRAMRL